MSAATITCPFCDSPDVEQVSAWGGQIITKQMRCRSCQTYFEAIRDDFEQAERPDEFEQAERPQAERPTT